jgi:hypothetical protein
MSLMFLRSHVIGLFYFEGYFQRAICPSLWLIIVANRIKELICGLRAISNCNSFIILRK